MKNLVTESFEPCTMYDKTTAPDGRGGVVASWVEGAGFDAAFSVDDSDEAKVAQAQGVRTIYTVTTTQDVNLQYHDVLRRNADGKVFRITSDGDDNKTPKRSRLYLRQVTAEEWQLPRGGQDD